MQCVIHLQNHNFHHFGSFGNFWFHIPFIWSSLLTLGKKAKKANFLICTYRYINSVVTMSFYKCINIKPRSFDKTFYWTYISEGQQRMELKLWEEMSDKSWMQEDIKSKMPPLLWLKAAKRKPLPFRSLKLVMLFIFWQFLHYGPLCVFFEYLKRKCYIFLFS